MLTIFFYLRISPAAAIGLLQPKDIFERLNKDPEQVAKRPLLSGEDPQGKLEALMENRRPQYAQVRA